MRFVQYFPRIGLRSSIENKLRILKIDPERFMGMALTVSMMLAIISFFLVEFPLPLFVFAGSFGFFLILPSVELAKRTANIEAELPFFLRNTGILIDLNIGFVKALETAAEQSALKDEMGCITKQIRNGLGVQKALSSFALSFDSIAVKRAVSQLISCYETGSSGSQIRKIGDELLALSRHKLKEQSSKSAMFGLLFIMTSGILPTFFLVYASAGNFVLETNIDESQIAIAMLVLFPLISFLIMLIGRASENENKLDFVLMAPAILFLSGFLFIPDLQIISFILGFGIAAYLVYANYRKEKRTEDIEERLPDALFSTGGLPKSTKAKDIFRMIGESGYGALSEEAEKSRRQIDMNVETDAVIDDLWERNNSSMLRKGCMMLKQMIKTNSLDKLHLLAEDMLAHCQIRREKAQIFSMQKYTLIFGALLIPLILKMTIYLLGSMGELMEDDSADRIIDFSSSIVPPYLMMYACICSISIAQAEGKRSSAALYFVVLAVMSQLVFHFITF